MKRFWSRLRKVALGGGMVGLGTWFFMRTTFTVSDAEALRRGEALIQNTKRALVIAAHPDDVEWYIAGTLKRLTEQGAKVYVVIATDGEKGPNKVNSPNLASTRRMEQEEAGAVIGYEEIFFFGLPDRESAKDKARLREMIDKVWQQVNPEIVFTFDPRYWQLPYLHPDHEGTGGVVHDYWRSLPADRPALYFFHSRRPNTAINVEPVLEAKRQALMAHQSQGISERTAQFNFSNLRKLNGQRVEALREETP